MKFMYLISLFIWMSLLACEPNKNSATQSDPEPTIETKDTSKTITGTENTPNDLKEVEDQRIQQTLTDTDKTSAKPTKVEKKNSPKKSESPNVQTTDKIRESVPEDKEEVESDTSTPKDEVKNENPQEPVLSGSLPKNIGDVDDQPKIDAISAFNHEQFDQLLRKYVSSTGKVNYRGLKKDQANLEAYLSLLQNNPVQKNWPKGKKLAYWINAYNAFTLKLILDNYPVQSITKLHKGKPWDVKWIKLGNKTYSLNEIENDIVRPRFKEPRIHFAVNCAAKSCPPLMNKAWTKDNLEASFERQTKAFINNSDYNTVSGKSASLSKIFEWYAVDFSDLTAFINRYSETKLSKGAKISYAEYDWALNE